MGSFVALRDGLEMLEQPLLRGLVVIRRHLQRAVRAGLLGVLRQINRLAAWSCAPVPASTLILPAANFTDSAMIRMCSS